MKITCPCGAVLTTSTLNLNYADNRQLAERLTTKFLDTHAVCLTVARPSSGPQDAR